MARKYNYCLTAYGAAIALEDESANCQGIYPFTKVRKILLDGPHSKRDIVKELDKMAGWPVNRVDLEVCLGDMLKRGLVDQIEEVDR